MIVLFLAAVGMWAAVMTINLRMVDRAEARAEVRHKALVITLTDVGTRFNKHDAAQCITDRQWQEWIRNVQANLTANAKAQQETRERMIRIEAILNGGRPR